MNTKLSRLALLVAASVALWMALQPSSSALALDEDTPFGAHLVAPAMTLSQGASHEVVIRYEVFKDHFIYRDMSSVTVLDAAGIDVGVVKFPKGISKFDKISDREREIFDEAFEVVVPISASSSLSPGSRSLRLLAKWQGCNLPKNYCLFPASKELVLDLTVQPPQTAPRGGPPKASSIETPPSAGKPPSVSFDGLAASASYQELDSEGKKHPVHARLFADKAAVSPGSTFRLAVHLQQQDGWHTYWKSPGDIGLPTRIEWGLPDAWEAAAFEFPVPLRFDQEGIISYGYDGQVLFFSEVQVPAEAEAGDVEIEAAVEWLVCEVSCIPGKASLKLPMKVLPGGAAAPKPSPQVALIDYFEAQHPVPATSVAEFAVEATLSVSAVQEERPFRAAIRVTPTGDQAISAPQSEGTWPAFAPIVRLNGMLMDSSISAEDSGGFTVLLDAETFEIEEGAQLPEGELIGGLLQVKVGDKWVRTEVTLPVPWAAADAEIAQSRSTLFLDKQDAVGAGEAQEETSQDRQDVSGANIAAAVTGQQVEESAGGGRFLWMLLLAFLGGMLLNIMPCVLPVLTMKLYSLVEQRDVSASDRRMAGVAYSAGIVFSFVALAIAVVVLRLSFGQDVLWGFQFQYPAYVASLAALVWLFGLSLFGVFEVPALGANKAAEASAREGAAGYFLTGVFATLLATPCSAPFLGTGMGFAFSLSTAGVLLFFAVAGLGLAAPFLVIAVVPALFRFLPRPGAWMDTFKQLMGFTLVATTLWLVDVLVGQVGADRGIGFLAVLLFLSIGSWVFGRWGGPMESGSRQLMAFVMAVAIGGLGAHFFLDLEMAVDEPASSSTISSELDFSESMPWQAFSEERLAELEGTTVFVDFTADWCLTCKVNEKTILETEKVRNAMRDLGVVPLKADWTRRDPVITRWLQRYGKAGVPFYLVIPGDRALDNIPLPEVITADGVIEALRRG